MGKQWQNKMIFSIFLCYINARADDGTLPLDTGDIFKIENSHIYINNRTWRYFQQILRNKEKNKNRQNERGSNSNRPLSLFPAEHTLYRSNYEFSGDDEHSDAILALKMNNVGQPVLDVIHGITETTTTTTTTTKTTISTTTASTPAKEKWYNKFGSWMKNWFTSWF